MSLHAYFRMLELDPVVARGEIRIVVEILVVGAGARSDARGLKSIDDFGYAALRSPFGDDRFERIFISLA